MTTLAYFDGSYGHLATISDDGHVHEIITTRAHPGHYVRIDDRRDYPQLCAGGARRGPTLTWASDPARMGEQYAADCRAKLYRSELGYRQAVAKAAESCK